MSDYQSSSRHDVNYLILNTTSTEGISAIAHASVRLFIAPFRFRLRPFFSCRMTGVKHILTSDVRNIFIYIYI